VILRGVPVQRRRCGAEAAPRACERVGARAGQGGRARGLDGPAGELGASVRGRAGRARESGCRRVELGHALN